MKTGLESIRTEAATQQQQQQMTVVARRSASSSSSSSQASAGSSAAAWAALLLPAAGVRMLTDMPAVPHGQHPIGTTNRSLVASRSSRPIGCAASLRRRFCDLGRPSATRRRSRKRHPCGAAWRWQHGGGTQ